MSGGDRTDSSTQVPVVRSVWVLVAASYHDMHLMSSFLKIPTPVVHIRYRKTPGEAGGGISGMGCMVPQPFVTKGNRSYPDFLAVTNDLRYPRYMTPTILL
jgi:hypothetical protein